MTALSHNLRNLLNSKTPKPNRTNFSDAAFQLKIIVRSVSENGNLAKKISI